MIQRRCAQRGCTVKVVPPATHCTAHRRADRRARHHTGYDDPAYRLARRAKLGRLCEHCHRHAATSVHHLDGNPSHNVLSNLMGVCDGCKPIVDADMRRRRDGR